MKRKMVDPKVHFSLDQIQRLPSVFEIDPEIITLSMTGTELYRLGRLDVYNLVESLLRDRNRLIGFVSNQQEEIKNLKYKPVTALKMNYHKIEVNPPSPEDSPIQRGDIVTSNSNNQKYIVVEEKGVFRVVCLISGIMHLGYTRSRLKEDFTKVPPRSTVTITTR